MKNKTAGHTPGPWKVTAHETKWHHLIETANYNEETGEGEIIANTRDSANSKDNARLIAAAPELLAGAKELEHYASRLPFESATVGLMDSLVRIRAAIAKAEGR